MDMFIEEQTHGNAIISAEGITIYLKGEIDSVEPGEYLTPFFTSVIEQMNDAVVCDLTELEFINSSGIKCIVSFILERDFESKVTFKLDVSKSWQLKTMEVIQSLDEEKIELLWDE